MTPANFDAFCQENAEILDQLVEVFSDYEPVSGVDRPRLRRWLQQFQAQHRALALKLARNMCYYNTKQLISLMPDLYDLVREQAAAERAREEAVLYVPWGRTGESGEEIARHFRNRNKLHSRAHQFLNRSELPSRLAELKNPVIFFLDDFIGTGKQVSDGWQSTVSQLVHESLPMYLAVVAACKQGIRRVECETPLKVIAVHTIGSNHQLMESACMFLASGDKNTIRTYCERAGNEPLGFGNLGLLVSFAYGTPNNTISVIRGSEKQRPWTGLLPRYEDLN